MTKHDDATPRFSGAWGLDTRPVLDGEILAAPHSCDETCHYCASCYRASGLEVCEVLCATALRHAPDFDTRDREGPIACAWFALCTNDATGTTAHPILGDVPTCDRCAAFAKR